MSIWTYVDARFKGEFDLEEAERVVGLEINWEDGLDEWERKCADQEDNPTKYLPMGSEGTLKAVIGTDEIEVHGSLRSFDNHKEIFEWFDRVCGTLNVRKAKCECECTWLWKWEFRR